MADTSLVPKLPSGFCDASAMLDAFGDALISSASGLSIDQVQESVTAGMAAATSVLVVGASLLLAPVVFGRNWLAYVQVLAGALAGIVGVNFLLTQYAGLVDSASASVGLAPGEGKCAATLAIQVVGALLFTWLVYKFKPIAHFILGGAAVGLCSYIASGLVTPIVSQQLGVVVADGQVTAAVGVLALLGGLLFAKFGDGMFDLILGLLGATLLAVAGLALAMDSALAAEAVATIKVEQYYPLYVAGIAALLYTVRSALVRAREGGKPTPKPAAKGAKGATGAATRGKPSNKPGAKRMY
jgi:hypothetical protein